MLQPVGLSLLRDLSELDTWAQTVCIGGGCPNSLWYQQADIHILKALMKMVQIGVALWVLQLLPGGFQARKGDFQYLPKPAN